MTTTTIKPSDGVRSTVSAAVKDCCVNTTAAVPTTGCQVVFGSVNVVARGCAGWNVVCPSAESLHTIPA